MSGQGLTVQRMRLSAVARNIANMNTTQDIGGEPYKREIVVVRNVQNTSFDNQLTGQMNLAGAYGGDEITSNSPGEKTNLQASTVKDNTPPRQVYDPSHPDADENGYVKTPNVNIVTEMVEMISAQRAFEANAGVIESAKNMARNALDI